MHVCVDLPGCLAVLLCMCQQACIHSASIMLQRPIMSASEGGVGQRGGGEETVQNLDFFVKRV